MNGLAKVSSISLKACLPCLRPILSLVIPSFVQGFTTQRSNASHQISAKFASVGKKRDDTLLTDSDQSHQFSQLNDNDPEAYGEFGRRSTGPDSGYNMQKINGGPGDIVVQRDINVHWNEPGEK
jgi:hypothetical protein